MRWTEKLSNIYTLTKRLFLSNTYEPKTNVSSL